LIEVLVGFALEAVRFALDEVRTTERIDCINDASLVGQNLLRTKCDLYGLLAGKCERLVHRIRVQRLRAAEHRRHCLEGGADDVVLRLLRGERTSRRLRMKAKCKRASGFCAVLRLHATRPDAACGAELRDLFEKVDMRIEEEGD